MPQALGVAQEKPDIARCKLAGALGVGLEQVNFCIKTIKGLVNKDYVEIGDWLASITEKSRLLCNSFVQEQCAPRRD